MSTLLDWSVTATLLLLGLAMACAAFRTLRGPRAQDRVLGFVLTEDATLGVRAVSPQNKEEVISPDRYGGTRAGKGKTLFRRGSFQPWDRPLLRYDVLYRQEEDEPAETEAGLSGAEGSGGAGGADDEGEE